MTFIKISEHSPLVNNRVKKKPLDLPDSREQAPVDPRILIGAYILLAVVLVGSLVGIGRDNTTFRHRERNLPADIAVYVLAEVHNGGGIGAPAKGSRNDTFLVSIKSEEARTEELASTMTFLIWLIGLFAIAGAALLVWARIKGQA